MVVSVVPLYFIANALQPVMEESIRTEGGQYFGFIVIGIIATTLLNTAVNVFPRQIGSSITTGTLEGLLATPTSITTLLAGISGFGFFWIGLRMLVLLVAAAFLGAQVYWGSFIPALAILLLTLTAYISFGVLAGALVLAFRTAGPLPQGVMYVSILLGGVYYPTRVIPSWIQDISQAVPLTYGLRALRRVALQGHSMTEVATDVGILALFVVGLLTISVIAFGAALQYARRAGTLTQY